MEFTNIQGLLPIGFLGLSLSLFAFRAFRNFIRVYFNPVEWTKDTTDENVPYPPNSEALVAALEGFNFHPIGSDLSKLRYLPQPTQEWSFANENGDMLAGFISSPGVKPFSVGFISYFPDRAMLMTTYPRGGRIQTPMFHCAHAQFNLDAAVKYHRERLDVWRQIHGEPISSGSLQDSEPLSQTIYHRLYRRRHQRRFWLHSLNYGVMFSLLALSGALMIFAALTVTPVIDANGNIVYSGLPDWVGWTAQFILLGTGLCVIMWVIIRLTHPTKPIDTPLPRPAPIRGQHPLHTEQPVPPPF